MQFVSRYATRNSERVGTEELARWMKLKVFGQFITFVKTLRTDTRAREKYIRREAGSFE